MEDKYDLQQWDPDYGENGPTSGAACCGTRLANAKDLNDDRYGKYIGAKLIIDEKSNNGGNLATLIRQATDNYWALIGQVYRKPMLETL